MTDRTRVAYWEEGLTKPAALDALGEPRYDELLTHYYLALANKFDVEAGMTVELVSRHSRLGQVFWKDFGVAGTCELHMFVLFVCARVCMCVRSYHSFHSFVSCSGPQVMWRPRLKCFARGTALMENKRSPTCNSPLLFFVLFFFFFSLFCLFIYIIFRNGRSSGLAGARGGRCALALLDGVLHLLPQPRRGADLRRQHLLVVPHCAIEEGSMSICAIKE